MGRFDKYDKISHSGKNYVVLKFLYKSAEVPVVIDARIFDVIRNLNETWSINDKGYVVYTHRSNDKDIEVNLHDIVKKVFEGDDYIRKPIVHINRLGMDNRYENLVYDIPNKDINKNLRKKKRTIQLPSDSGIDVSKIPTYVWYLKKDDTHGDRFMVDVGDISWKSTSSTIVSVRYKLEETKKYLRHLKHTRADLFDDYSMNGDYNADGIEKLKSFYDIVQPLGYKLKVLNKNLSTDQLLSEDTHGLTNFETYLLKSFDPIRNTDSCVRQRCSEYSKFITNKLPPYCKYSAGSETTGEYFYVDDHPEYDGMWTSSTDKYIPLNKKLAELKAFIKHL